MLSDMGNQERRAARAKQRRHRASGLRPEPVRPAAAEAGLVDGVQQQRQRDEAYALLQDWSWQAARLPAGSVRLVVERDVRERSAGLLALVEGLLVDELGARLARAYEHGWEPRDVVHVARRGVRGQATGLVVAHARANGVLSRAPQRWCDQLQHLGLEPDRPVARWRPVGPTPADPVAVWTDLLLLLRLLAELAPLEPIGPPPSRWGSRTAADEHRPTSDRDRVLGRIRALLAKAESTLHPAEAEALTAKAQELMTRHAVDEALLRGRRNDEIPVETRRIHLDAPYAGVKATLLHAVAQPNRSRAILIDPYDIAVLVGTPLDVDQTEMLYTSLLIQATRAMAEAGARRAGSYDRSPTFRKSFLLSYATRIGERLREADRSATAGYGAELVPLLRRQADAVDAEFERRFPHTTTKRSGYLDARGWEAGRAAADRARIVAGQLRT